MSAKSEATGTTEEKATKTFSNLPINVTGLSESIKRFKEPTSGETNLTVEGTNEDSKISKHLIFSYLLM